MRDKEKNCGFVGISPRIVVYGNRELSVAHCLDFMVHPDCRAGVAALRLANKCIESVKEQQYDFSFAFPNNNSLNLITSPKCGYKTVFTPMLLVRPLSKICIPKQKSSFLPEILRKLLPRMLAKYCSIRACFTLRSIPEGEAVLFDQFDKTFDELWQRVRSKISIAIKRDATYLNWRFHDNPIYNYRKTCWSTGDIVNAYIVSSDRKLFDIPSTLIVDFIADAEDRTILPALIEEAAKQANQQGSHVIATQAIYGTDAYSVFVSMGFIPVPQKLNPKRFNCTVHDLEHNLPLLVDPKCWFFTWSDMDVV